jgi:hypothetical protein
MAAEWSVAGVVEWVASQPIANAEAVASKFRDEEIDGETLLSYAELPRDSRLRADFELSIGKANALRKAICLLAGVDPSAGTPLAASPAHASSRGGASARSPTEEGIPPTSPSGSTASHTPPSVARSLRLEPESTRGSRSSRQSSAAAGEGELRSMKLTKLMKRASAAGVSEEQLEDAEDADDHRGAVIKLILANTVEDDGAGALRAELSAMKLTKLMKRASAAGVSEEQLEDAEDADDHRGAVIKLIVQKELGGRPALGGQASASPARLVNSTSSADSQETSRLLRHGSSSQREQAYKALEAAAKRSDVPLLCACVPPMFQIMCMDVSEVDAAEYQRVGLLLSKMVAANTVAVASTCFKDDIWLSPYAASGSALGVLLAKPPASLTEADALTFSCQYSWMAPFNSYGWTPVLAAAGVDVMFAFTEGWIPHAPTAIVQAPTHERNLRLCTLVMTMLRQKKLADPHAIAGAWYLLC